MRILILIPILLLGCQTNMQNQTKQNNTLTGVSFGYMTTQAKQQKNTFLKKLNLTPVPYSQAGTVASGDYPALKDSLEPQGILVNRIGQDIVMTLPADALFTNRLSLNFSDHASDLLDYLMPYLKKRTNTYLEITGHTDSTGNADANQRLSIQKAKEIARYMIDEGIHPLRIFINGRGENAPVSPEPASNRRIDVRISPMVE